MLSAIETDLREMIIAHFGHEKNLEAFLGKELFEKCLNRFQKEFGQNAYIKNLSELAEYMDYADSYQFLSSKSSRLPGEIAKSLKELTPKLDDLVPIRNRAAHSRPLNFDDLAIVLDTSDIFVSHSCLAWPALNEVRQKLKTNPEFVLSQSIPDSDERTTNNNLPIPDFDETGFVGRKAQVEQLLGLVKGPYPVITVIGEGGLGKTAIALKVAYEILEDADSRFDSVVWTTAKTSTITAQEIVRIEDAITSSLGIVHGYY